MADTLPDAPRAPRAHLTPRLALQLAAPHTWPAAIMPVMVAAGAPRATTGRHDGPQGGLVIVNSGLLPASVKAVNG